MNELNKEEYILLLPHVMDTISMIMPRLLTLTTCRPFFLSFKCFGQLTSLPYIKPTHKWQSTLDCPTPNQQQTNPYLQNKTLTRFDFPLCFFTCHGCRFPDLWSSMFTDTKQPLNYAGRARRARKGPPTSVLCVYITEANPCILQLGSGKYRIQKMPSWSSLAWQT